MVGVGGQVVQRDHAAITPARLDSQDARVADRDRAPLAPAEFRALAAHAHGPSDPGVQRVGVVTPVEHVDGAVPVGAVRGNFAGLFLPCVAPGVVVPVPRAAVAARLLEPRMLAAVWLSTRSTNTRMPRLSAVRIISTGSPAAWSARRGRRPRHHPNPPRSRHRHSRWCSRSPWPWDSCRAPAAIAARPALHVAGPGDEVPWQADPADLTAEANVAACMSSAARAGVVARSGGVGQ